MLDKHVLIGHQNFPEIRWPDNVTTVDWLTLYIGDLSTKNFENRLPFELQCWVNTHFKGFVELSSLLINVERFCFCKMV